MTTTTTAEPSGATRRLPVVIIIACLLVAGGVLLAAVREFGQEWQHGADYSGGPMPAIHAAAQAGDAAGISRELSRGVAVDLSLEKGETWSIGMTPLMLASMNAKPEAVRTLLQAGANANARSRNGHTALILAAAWADAATVQALVEKGVLMDARTEEGWTALTLGAARGKAECVTALINAGADVNGRNKWGQTPLHLACQSGDADKVEAVLRAGPDVNIGDAISGETPLLAAVRSGGSTEIVTMLIESRAQVDKPDHDGVTALMVAADRADQQKVTALLAAGASRTATDASGRTAAQWAEGRGDDLGGQVAELLRP